MVGSAAQARPATAEAEPGATEPSATEPGRRAGRAQPQPDRPHGRTRRAADPDDTVGAAQVIRPPIGSVDVLQPLGTGQLLLAGWAADPDEGEARPRIDVYVGGPVGVGIGRSYGPVDRYRPDVAAVHGGRSDRGYAMALTDLAAGPLTVCAYAIGRIESASALLGCREATVPGRGAHDPFGTVDLVEVPAERAVRAHGWAIDPDEPTAPLEVVVQALQTDPAGSALLGVPADPCRGAHACVPNRPFLPDDDKDTLAAVARPDVAAAFPGVGAAHGYDHTVTRQEYRPSPLPFDTARLEPGVPTRVCAWARNRGPGTDTLLGCRWVDVPAPSGPALDGQIYVPRASTEPLPPGVVAVEGWVARAGAGGRAGDVRSGPGGHRGRPARRRRAPRPRTGRRAAGGGRRVRHDAHRRGARSAVPVRLRTRPAHRPLGADRLLVRHGRLSAERGATGRGRDRADDTLDPRDRHRRRDVAPLPPAHDRPPVALRPAPRRRPRGCLLRRPGGGPGGRGRGDGAGPAQRHRARDPRGVGHDRRTAPASTPR